MPRLADVRVLLLLPALAATMMAAASEAPREFSGATPLAWAERLAKSEMARLGDSLDRAANPQARWDYAPSVFALALWQLGERTGDPAYQKFAARAAASHVTPEGEIAGYRPDEYNIDHINPGKVLLEMYSENRDERLARAAKQLRRQMETHPRTSEGGFWHKQRYPHQMWLDGLYMASPYLAHYAQLFDEPALHDEVARQILLMDRHSYDAKTGLHYHAWDEARAQSWADPQTGRSPNFWSRSIGWYAMAIVDTLDYLPVTQPELDQIVDVLRRLADGVVRWQDESTGLWWQVTNLGERQGNYLEASGSAMFVYALAKGVNRGYLPREKYEAAILRGFEGLVRDLIKTDANGRVSLTQVCSVAGLGYTTREGRPRDGTFEYYISEPVVANDPKGTGPFIMAGIEVDRLLRREAAPLRVTGWESLPALLARIQAPEFPARDFPITDFGAKSDGATDCTDAIRRAIEACHAAGGGRVIVAGGEFLTGAVHLKSNVNLHIAEGATLRFSPDPAKYLPVVFTRYEGTECMNYSPLIYAFEQENIAVTGGGTLDGSATVETWWAWSKVGAEDARARQSVRQLLDHGARGTPVAERVFGAGHGLRPNFIQPYRCRNVLIEGVRIIRSPMWEIHPVLCTNVTVRGVNITTHGPNNDGCNPESSRDVLIEDCVFDTGDDCIAIKSGRNNDGRRVGAPSENIVVRNCTMKDGHGGVVIGSEISGDCRNVFIENCRMDSPQLDRALRFKSNAMRGGVVENIFMRDVQVGRVADAVLGIDFLYETGPAGPHRPVLRNVQIERVTSESSPRVMSVAGFPAATIEGIRFIDCHFRGVEGADVVHDAGAISFQRVTIEPAVAPTRPESSVRTSSLRPRALDVLPSAFREMQPARPRSRMPRSRHRFAVTPKTAGRHGRALTRFSVSRLS